MPTVNEPVAGATTSARMSTAGSECDDVDVLVIFGASWRVVQPVLGDVVPVTMYRRGTWGPPEADALLPPGDVCYNPA